MFSFGTSSTNEKPLDEIRRLNETHVDYRGAVSMKTSVPTFTSGTYFLIWIGSCFVDTVFTTCSEQNILQLLYL